MKTFKLLLLSLFITQFSFAQTLQDTLAMVDKALSQYETTNPGCQLSIERNGKMIYSKAIGMADLEHNVPLTTQSIIEAGSVSKQFVAAAILLLAQQEKLSLNDNVRKYIPELPDYGTPIKLHHMLHHTSGFRDWGQVASLTGWGRTTKYYTNDDVLEIIARQKQLNNKPGDEYIYSNSNFNLFAIIVQRVSGLNLADFTKKYIFVPAGMTHTQWRDNPKHIVQNRAIAYSKTINGYEIDMPNEYAYGNGGLLTTTEDLLKWCDFYQHEKLGTPSLLAELLYTEPLNNGNKNGYAAGLVIGKVRGWDNISHSGSTAGYRAYLETYPELKLTVAILSNTPQFNIRAFAGKINKLFVANKTNNYTEIDKPKEAPVVAQLKLSSEELKAYEGSYFSEETNSTAKVVLNNGKLMIRLNVNVIYPLQATSKNTFLCNDLDATIQFNTNKSGKINSFKASIARARNIAFEKIK